jgi:hypothetical protein
MTGPVPVGCFTCGAEATVNRITANLRCGCGSSEVDLVDGPEVQAQLASLRTARLSFLDFMRQGASSPVGEEIKGWNVYQGPPAGKNPRAVAPGDQTCRVCRGTGIAVQDGGTCRACGGDGKMTPTTSPEPEPLVAKHPGQSTQTSVPFMGRRIATAPVTDQEAKLPTPEQVLSETVPDYTDRGQRRPHSTDPFSWDDTSTHYPRADTLSPANRYREQRDYSQPPPGHFAMPGASCPNCGQDPTHLVKDHKENAWWHCPDCGPLANIDKNPAIDPYSPGDDFRPNPKNFKSGKTAGAYRGKDRGSILRIALVVAENNSGLTPREVVHLARTTASRYLEKS